MSTKFQLVSPPDTMPDWYPPIDPEHPTEYSIRFVELDMFIAAMSAIGVVYEDDTNTTTQSNEHVSATTFSTPGEIIEPEKCAHISRALRRFATEQIPSNLFHALQQRWDSVQERFRYEVEGRGEIVLSGLELFPYDDTSLRGVLLHWGAYNAIAADSGGIRVVE